ncbi:winged helix-turn-helix transcriptional regulator [Amycolatopsis taiwanensis]|uniref:winged helix-turn-helix transcriptional regulator n=1 Tax=Amycolatopsis taiwanensis TaxID=342230 RepID=UPI002557305E|nr:winged helix-turn-helix transcriptional regulator [Amycolatopsis taiwanensis]
MRSPGHPLPRPATAPLRRLQFNGLVDRHAHPDAPSGVEYELTALGRTLLAPIEAVGAWAFEYSDDVMAAQEAACFLEPP